MIRSDIQAVANDAHARSEKPSAVADSSCSAAVGVVVIGRNEGQRLLTCLASVRGANFVVYVDSGSTDGSVEVAERLGASIVSLDLTHPFTAARARNAGLDALRNVEQHIEFVQFVDGDCELTPGWITNARSFIRSRPDVAIVCGRLRERHPEISTYNRLCDIEWDTPVGEAEQCGGIFLSRIAALSTVDGFRPELIAGEEPDLCVRLREKGWRIWRLDAEMGWHDADMRSFGQWWRRSVRSGHAFMEVSQLHRGSRFGVFRRETRRAMFWGGAFPVLIGIAAVVQPAALGLALLYPFQVCRIAWRRGPAEQLSWSYAISMVVGRFAELEGIMRYVWRLLRRGPVRLIEYK